MSENPGYDVGAFWAASGLQDFMRSDWIVPGVGDAGAMFW